MHGKVFLVLGLTVLVRASPSNLGLRKTGRIVRGEKVSHSLFPFLVSIEYRDSSRRGWSPYCGGSIINRDTILTACHCATKGAEITGFRKKIAYPWTRRIVAGTGDWNRNSETRQIVTVRQIVTHPKCQNFNLLNRIFLNDVALFFLNGALEYGPEVQPIRLPHTDVFISSQYLKKLIHNGSWCTAVGWGRTDEDNPKQSEILIGAAVQLLTADACRQRFCKMTYKNCRTDFDGIGQFCVASPTASNCLGDSGGPLICGGIVVGTVSYGDRCLPNFPTVYQGLLPIMEVLSYYGRKVDTYDFGSMDDLISPVTDLTQSTGQLSTIDLSSLTVLRNIHNQFQNFAAVPQE